MKAVIFSAHTDAALLAVLSASLKVATFGETRVTYVLADEVVIDSPMSTLSLTQGSPLKVDVQTHVIASVISGKLHSMGFVA